MNHRPCYAMFEIITTVKPLTLSLVAIFRTIDDAQTYLTSNSAKTLIMKTLYFSDEELSSLVTASTKSIAYNF